MLAAGAPCEPLTAAAAAARFPGVTLGGPALLEPDSCVISADAALRALAAAVPDLRTGVTVTGLADDGRRVSVATGSGSVTASAAVVCAGPWTGGLLATAGIAVPSAATLEQVGYLAPAADPAPPCRSSSATATRRPTGCPCQARRCTRSGSIRAARRPTPTRRTSGRPGLTGSCRRWPGATCRVTSRPGSH